MRCAFSSISLSVFLVGCTLPTISLQRPCEEREKGVQRDTCLLEQALDEQVVAHCEEIANFEVRERCFVYLALQSCDASLCDRLKLAYSSEGCKEELALLPQCAAEEQPEEKVEEQKQQAPDAAGDPCGALEGAEQDRCYERMALEEGDPLFCERIHGEDFAHLESNPPRDKCLFSLAVEQCNPSLCDRIRGGEQSFTPVQCKQMISRECP
ncbi:hypothetical protein COU80_00225 [Candidatus Peregrinibacteria bacterium CG10_big_fil_rev_8_21_14_0_10_55_24]|nr:MAG: hypothetical protein COU80_00225 [Candidatus Peregrinibacteria bacterium CG10_big_fil_rev_8_21_14_0_10_55_24]